MHEIILKVKRYELSTLKLISVKQYDETVHCRRTLSFGGSGRLQRSRRGLAKVIIAGSQVAAHARRRTWLCRQKSDISPLYLAFFQSNRRALIDNGGAPIPDVR